MIVFDAKTPTDPLDKEERNHKPRILRGLIIVLCVTVFSGIVFWQFAKPERKSSADQNNPAVDNLLNDNQFDQKTTTTPATSNKTAPSTIDPELIDPYHYYDLGLTQATNKQYEDAISNFQKAIDLKPTISEFYSKKAEAEVSNNQKGQAIETIKTGLGNIPNDPTLKNKLDILQTVVQ